MPAMTSSRKLVFSGKMPWALRAVAALLIPINLLAAVPMNIVVAAISPAPPVLLDGKTADSLSSVALSFVEGAKEDQLPLLQPPASVLLASRTQQPASAIPHPPAIPKFDPPSPHLAFSAAPTDRELITARCFEEPLAPLAGDPLPGENADLAQALTVFRHSPQNLSPLTEFLNQHPDSRWNASLLANLGLLYRNQGRWSKALATFEDAWALGKGANNPLLKAVTDRVLGELVQLHARLGHMDRLETLFKETKDRDVQGAGTMRLDGARSGLWLMQNDPGDAFRCGPFALGEVFELLHPGQKVPKEIEACKSTVQGTNLATIEELAHKVGLDYQAAFRTPGAPVIVPSIVNWKVGHFAALTRQVGDKYLSQDATFSADTLISSEVLDAEASGYFLVPAGILPPGWRAVDAGEAKTVFGKGSAGPGGPPPPPCDATTAGPCQKCTGMAGYNLELSGISLMLMDTPVGYTPPIGPAVKFTANYNHREAASMTNLSNLGNKWSFDWLNYIQAPSTANVVSYGPGGGQLAYSGYNSTNGSFSPQLLTQNTLTQNSDGSYTLLHPDGAQEMFTVSDGTHIFRKKYIDPQGNAITYGYDGNYRLVTVTDAINQTTVLSYENSTDPTNPAFYNITKVTDPFGRFAKFAYNGSGQLISITDVLGITSSFIYGTGDFITSLTTPYGTTQFAVGDVDQYHRWLEATDPVGAKERIEFNGLGDDPIPGTPSPFPTGFVGGAYGARDTFFWDKKAMEVAPGDYTKARITHFLHVSDGGQVAPVAEATKQPLENWVFNSYYPGQGDPRFVGTSNQPSKVIRFLDNGTEQDYLYQYNATGNKTQSIDPLGRETDYTYDTNNIDLLQVKQKNGSGYDLLSSSTYNLQHLPLTTTDASGQVTIYAYNSAGQVHTVTNAKHETTTYWYSSSPTWTGQPTLDPNATGYLVETDGPVAGATTRFNYDGFGRLQAVTDSEGYTVTTTYDVFDRPTKVTYPDGTFTQVLYNRLDTEWTQDRLGRWTHLLHDALRHLVVQEDPLLRKTSYDWCVCGALEGITDPAGNTTTWLRDVQSRVTSKIYPDGTSLNYAYETTTSRLKSVTDALNQVTNYQYYLDNSLYQVSYTDTTGHPLTPATPTVSYTYDPNYLRIATMADGIGTSNYTYNPVPPAPITTPVTGANQLYTVNFTTPQINNQPPTLAYTTTYGYDQLGRVISTSIDNANTSSVGYDALGRVTSATNPLGAFGYTYVNQTGRLDHVTYPNSQRTNYFYYPNSAATPGNDDQRLQQIVNLAPGGADISTFGYTYNAVGNIMTWSKQFDAGAALTSTFGYDAADQLISASVPPASGPTPQAYQYQYDLAGNRTTEQIDTNVTGSTHNNLNQLKTQVPGGDMVFTGTVGEPVTMTVGGNPATVDANDNWRGHATVTLGANAIPLVATDVDHNTTNKAINVTVSGGAARTLAYDANGNLTNDGAGKTYTFDAANRIVSITQASGVTGFVYDGLGRRVKETLNGALIKQWVWCGDAQPCEERDASNNVTKRFYGMGEQIAGANYFFTLDHLGSIREMSDSTGAIRARYDYDPYGRVTKLTGDLDADFGFTGFYRHQASGLCLTLNRAYAADLGRWLTRDLMPETDGTNLYQYCLNNPINAVDVLGLFCVKVTIEYVGVKWISGSYWWKKGTELILPHKFPIVYQTGKCDCGCTWYNRVDNTTVPISHQILNDLHEGLVGYLFLKVTTKVCK
jgi:RHS repeat-associated protein